MYHMISTTVSDNLASTVSGKQNDVDIRGAVSLAAGDNAMAPSDDVTASHQTSGSCFGV
jgi:hypothetical protein